MCKDTKCLNNKLIIWNQIKTLFALAKQWKTKNFGVSSVTALLYLNFALLWQTLKRIPCAHQIESAIHYVRSV